MIKLLYWLMRITEYPARWATSLHEWIFLKWETRVNQWWSNHPEEKEKLIQALIEEFKK